MKLGVLEFFEDIIHFVSLKRFLGVDIGTASIKMVEVSRLGDQPVLENYSLLETTGYLLRGNEAIQTSALKFVEADVIKLLRILLQEAKPKTKNVVASVPNFAAFVVPVDLPLMPEAETAKAIPFQARQYIPMLPSEVKLDWVKSEEFKNEKGQRYQRVIITAIPVEVVRKYQKVFQEVGLRLSALEVESQALVRSLHPPNDSATMIIDIGAESTSLLIAEGGLAKQVAQTDYGGVSLTQALSRTLDIGIVRAEELKRRRGLKGLGGEFELSTSLLTFLDVIIQEAERLRSVFERMSAKKVLRLILVGGGANLPGVEEYFGGQMKLAVQSPYPLRYFRFSNELEPIRKSLNRELAVALGLTLRFFL